MIRRDVGTALASAAVVALALSASTRANAQPDAGVEPGALPERWTPEDPDCSRAPHFLVHEYNPEFVIIRQSGCTNFEKPFLYLLFGSKQALLIDTGATGVRISDVIEEQMRRHGDRKKSAPLPLLVVHSHGHGDHTAGDDELRRRPATTVVEARPEALSAFFGLDNWPQKPGEYDLGGRVIDVIPIPGHEPASIALYDRRTGNLLTGDSLYPGRLYVRDAPAFVASVERLVQFTANRNVVHVLGAHIENSRTPYVDYPQGTRYQPDEHVLELGRAHLLELQDALRSIGTPLQRRVLRDFTVWPL
jgi:glyoxylase-like metal-dependent hydrolase (beta-lactamase superfamily II)